MKIFTSVAIVTALLYFYSKRRSRPTVMAKESNDIVYEEDINYEDFKFTGENLDYINSLDWSKVKYIVDAENFPKTHVPYLKNEKLIVVFNGTKCYKDFIKNY